MILHSHPQKLRALAEYSEVVTRRVNHVEIRCWNTHAAFILLLFAGGWPSLLTNRNCFGGGRVGDAPLTVEDIVPPKWLVGESHLAETHSHVGFWTIEGRRIVQEWE